MQSKLSTKEKLSYGVGSLGASTIYGLMTTYLIVFYTDYIGISTVVIATLFLVARIFDAVTDIGMGLIIDNTRTRWGRFRPYLFVAPWFIAITTVLCFTNPNIGDNAKIIWVYVTYILWGISFTARDIPYWSMSASLTQDSKERNSVVMVPRTLAMVGIITINVVTLPLVKLFGDGDSMRGWQMVAMLYGALCIIFSMVTFFNVKERQNYNKPSRRTLKDYITAIKENNPLKNLLMYMGLSEIILTVKNIFPIYYLTYNYDAPHLIPLFMGMYAVSSVIGALISPSLAGRFGKKKVAIIGSVGASIATVGLFFAGYDSLIILFVWVVISGLLEGTTEVVRTSMLADTVEYGEWKTNERSEGIIFSANIFKTKVASAIGGAMGALVLGWTGYIPNIAQSTSTLNGIHLAFTFIPGILVLVALIPLRKYDLSEAKYNKILEEIRSKDTSITSINNK